MHSRVTQPARRTFDPRLASASRAAEIRRESRGWPSWDLTPAQVCEIELLLTGALSPAEGYLGREDLETVRASMRLSDGQYFPWPLTLQVTSAFAEKLRVGDRVALRDAEGVMLAALHVSGKWEAEEDGTEPTQGSEAGAVHLSGPVEGIQLPVHYDFAALHLTPAVVRERLAGKRVLAVHVPGVMHRADREAASLAAREAGAHLLVQVLATPGGGDEAAYYARVRCVRAALKDLPPDAATLAVLPFPPGLEGRRGALCRALVARNYGCTHLLVDHAPARGDGDDLDDSWPDLVDGAGLLGIELVRARPMAYVQGEDRYVPADNAPEGARAPLTGRDVHEQLAAGEALPAWFTFPEVASELHRVHPPRREQGFTVFFTGLSGSGKSTIANALRVKLLEKGGRPVTLLDGDLVRKHLSSELGFSREHRDLNVRRIGYVASEITKNGGVAICAPIAPFDRVRQDVRRMIEPHGGFVLVYVSTPLETCEARDRKGLYAKARAGLLQQFTGVSDPYEEPLDAELVIDTVGTTPEEAADRIMRHLVSAGYLNA